jgi:hypothetical protein
MSVVIATHGHCFDGLASATVFTRLWRELAGTKETPIYRGCGYGVTQTPDPDRIFTGDHNALLDYRFMPHDGLTWYFDHHPTAFTTEAHRTIYDDRVATGKYHFDSTYGSCTRLIADVARERFGVSDPHLDELVRIADKVDTASFESAESAIARTDPLLQLVTVVEHHGQSQFIAKYAQLLLERPLAEVALCAEIQRRFRPIGVRQGRFVEQVREAGTKMGRVAFVDLTQHPVDTIAKFVTYALFPDCVYSVLVATLRGGAKVSVGFNPWNGRGLDADIGAICARYGGGGHAVVGAIQYPKADVESARKTALEIVRELEG